MARAQNSLKKQECVNQSSQNGDIHFIYGVVLFEGSQKGNGMVGGHIMQGQVKINHCMAPQGSPI